MSGLSQPQVQMLLQEVQRNPGLLAAAADQYGPGLMRSPITPQMPGGAYPFMPSPATGPVLRTNPQGPVRNIAGRRA
jgi:hypothetical protein